VKNSDDAAAFATTIIRAQGRGLPTETSTPFPDLLCLAAELDTASQRAVNGLRGAPGHQRLGTPSPLIHRLQAIRGEHIVRARQRHPCEEARTSLARLDDREHVRTQHAGGHRQLALHAALWLLNTVATWWATGSRTGGT
jgi:hypothetical protein